MMNTYHQNYPTVNTIRYGTMRPPEAINPIFSSWLWDYEVCDRLYTGYLTINPYKPTTAGKSPAGGDMPWMCYDWKYELMANGNANVTLYFRDDITWHDGQPFTVDDLEYTIFLGAAYGDSWGYSDMIHVTNFVKWNNYVCSIEFDFPSIWSYLTCNYDIIPKHIFDKIDIPSPNDYESGHHGYWPGETALAAQVHAPLTFPIHPEDTWVGTNMWKYRTGSLVKGAGGGITLDAYNGFWMKILQGDIDLAYKWNSTKAPLGGYMGNYTIGLPDLVMLANAYGSNGTGEVPFSLGKRGDWEPGCDLAPPSGVVGLADLVTLARNYGKSWGENP
jgi:ABC-type transport system substrate-binding protein